MNLFQYIIEVVMKNNYEYKKNEFDTHSKMFSLYPMYFFTSHNDNLITKYDSLRGNILDNNYLADEQKELFFTIFSKAQTIYFSLMRIVRFYKFKKTKLFDMQCDIRFNPLENFPENQKITLIHYDTKYIFRLSDLCKIWKESLLNCKGIKPEPLMPKNPFIRKEFTKEQLYATYFKLRETSFNIPLCIQGFFKYEFDLFKFRFKCYAMLKDCAIDDYFYNESSITSKLYDIGSMLRYRRDLIGDTHISEHAAWDTKKNIVKQLESFLIMHLYATESCNPIKRNMFDDKCSVGLIKYFKENPSFCRRDIIWPRRNRRRETILPSLNLPSYTEHQNTIIEEVRTSPLALPPNLRDSIDEILNTPFSTQINNINREILQEVERAVEESIENDDIDEESREIDYPDEDAIFGDELIPSVTVNLNDITDIDNTDI
jgi:hypothetical protein